MSNNRYVKGINHLGLGEIDLVNGDIRALLINSNHYTPTFSSDEFLSDIPSDAIVATMDSPLENKRFVDCVFDCDDYVFPAVTSSNIDAVVFYYHTGVDETSILLIYVDNSDLFPLNSSGWDIKMEWANGANKIFRL